MNNALEYFTMLLRDKNTRQQEFRQAALQIAKILAFQVAERLPMESVEIQTPIALTKGSAFKNPIVLVPVLRSGMAMLEPFLEVFTDARVGIVGLKRDEVTAQAHWYYRNVPPIDKTTSVLILDPMIATGGTAIQVIDYLCGQGAVHKNIIFVSIIGAPEGLAVIAAKFPDVMIMCGTRDVALTKDKFITPGLGDFGDRYFGTTHE